MRASYIEFLALHWRRKMSDKAFNLTGGGIKCDTEGCDYKNSSVAFEDIGEYVDRACPKCGGNLLTREDYQALTELHSIVDALNSFELVQPDPSSKRVQAELKMKGDGTIEMGNITEIEPSKNEEKGNE